MVLNPSLTCPIKRNFELSFTRTRCCSKCKFETRMDESDLNLSLRVPDSPSSVQAAISQHFVCQDIEKTCDKCNEYTPHRETTRVNRLPRIVVVHFQRLTPACDPETVSKQSKKTI